jgi:Fur family peroxide stress response transcriptional regulator
MEQRVHKRTTQQLQVVYQVVCQSCSHPTADDVYLWARRILLRISLGTVYHNLQRLVDEGKIGVLSFGDRIARYDPTTVDHAHLVCRHCGLVQDVVLDPRVLGAGLKFLTRSGYTIFSHSFVAYGLCPACEKGCSGTLQTV